MLHTSAASGELHQDPEHCPICRRGAPTNVVAELEASWVTMGEDTALRGAAALFFRRHAVELHHLSETEGAAFMRDARRLSAALQTATGAAKMNYEMHGNTIPHLHMHFFPRYRDDPFRGRPIDPRAGNRPIYAPGEFQALRRELQMLLDVAGGGTP